MGCVRLGRHEHSVELFDGFGVRRAAVAEHQRFAATGGFVGGFASVRQLTAHRLLESSLELLARQHGKGLVVVEHEADALEIQADDLAKHTLRLAHVAQGVQLGCAHDDYPVGQFESGNRRLVKAATAIDEGRAELAFHGAQRGAHMGGGDYFALFWASTGHQYLQATGMLDQVLAQCLAVEVSQAFGRHRGQRSFRMQAQKGGREQE